LRNIASLISYQNRYAVDNRIFAQALGVGTDKDAFEKGFFILSEYGMDC